MYEKKWTRMGSVRSCGLCAIWLHADVLSQTNWILSFDVIEPDILWRQSYARAVYVFRSHL